MRRFTHFLSFVICLIFLSAQTISVQAQVNENEGFGVYSVPSRDSVKLDENLFYRQCISLRHNLPKHMIDKCADAIDQLVEISIEDLKGEMEYLQTERAIHQKILQDMQRHNAAVLQKQLDNMSTIFTVVLVTIGVAILAFTIQVIRSITDSRLFEAKLAGREVHISTGWASVLVLLIALAFMAVYMYFALDIRTIG